MNQKLDVMQRRRVAVKNLSAIVLSDIPDGLPELPSLRLKISKVRALILVMEQTLQALYEREVPRSLRMADPNGFLSHMESRVLVEHALTLIREAKKL